ncbi:ankyrin repeat protein [Acanthamoeba polyphaga moumouvirus]|uniref:Ankyrin repeat protein n=2 Tax=Moumouvirus TaxID=3080801 RepID=L7RCH1_9VIRU|nr:ankyrin repeat protein [Acanthamoeba polyphaga moumouvirus]AEX62356.1 hypothetical protein mv_L151 [Moumouvirus Monve]AGC02294.1 ankyrin repeat protein [Acanthamoeba polyphaga moumouvirus]AQN68636.1 ankyrin repeat protein [Saudi moumouvirus]
MYVHISKNFNKYLKKIESKENIQYHNNIYYDSQNLSFKLTKIENINKLFNLGTDITIVELPKDYPNFLFKEATMSIDKLSEEDIILNLQENYEIYDAKTNMCKFLETYSLYNFLTYEKFGLDIQKNIHIIDFASRDNKIEFLNWYIDNNYIPIYSEDALYYASIKGHLNILNWWLNSGLKLKYDENILDDLSIYGEINVLNWWLNSGLELKYSAKALDYYYGFDENKIKVLNWWLNSGLELKYTKNSIDLPSSYVDTDILNWWLNSGLELKYSEKSLDLIKKDANIIEIIKWWINSGLEIKYSSEFIRLLIWWNKLECLQYMMQNGLEIKCNKYILDCAENVEILNWWIKNGLPMLYSEVAMDFCSNTKILDWWLESGLPLKYSENVFDYYEDNDNIIEKFNWWLKSGLPLKYTTISIDSAFENNDINILNWWVNSGLPLKYSTHSRVKIISKQSYECNIETIKWWKNQPQLSEEYLKYIDTNPNNYMVFNSNQIIKQSRIISL